MDRDPYSMIARLELLMESSSQGGRRGSEDVQSDTASHSGETVHSEVSSALQSTPQVRHRQAERGFRHVAECWGGGGRELALKNLSFKILSVCCFLGVAVRFLIAYLFQTCICGGAESSRLPEKLICSDLKNLHKQKEILIHTLSLYTLSSFNRKSSKASAFVRFEIPRCTSKKMSFLLSTWIPFKTDSVEHNVTGENIQVHACHL